MMEAPGFLGDLSLYPDGIYGSTEEIERFAEASMEATLLLSDEHERTKIENEMDKMEQQYGTSKSREDHKQQYSLKFKDFIRNEILEDPAIETMSEEKLAYYLRRFYWSLRKKDGEPYKPSSLICIRAGISNYLNEAPVSRNIDILHGEKFQSANNMLKSMVGFWLKNGKEEIKHYDAIEMKDESLLYAYFDRSDPVKLQDEAWYILICHFGNRGREGMRDLTFESLESNADSNNCRHWVLKGPKKIRLQSLHFLESILLPQNKEEFMKMTSALLVPSDASKCIWRKLKIAKAKHFFLNHAQISKMENGIKVSKSWGKHCSET